MIRRLDFVGAYEARGMMGMGKLVDGFQISIRGKKRCPTKA
jgi:hypothetical protein